MKTVVVTGAAGFIGSHLTEYLIRRGYRVIGVDWLTYAGRIENLRDVVGDTGKVYLPLFGTFPRRHALYAHYAEEGSLRLAEFSMEAKETRDLSWKIPSEWEIQPVPTSEDLALFIRQWEKTSHPFFFVLADASNRSVWPPLLASAAGVFHLAAQTHVDRSFLDLESFLLNDLYTTVSLLEEARRADYAGKIVHVSTDEVYGETWEPVDEEAPLKATNPYALSKLAADRFAHAFFQHRGLSGVVVRPSNVFGPRQHPEKFIPLMIIRALRQEPLPVYGDGKQERTWVFVEDMVEGLVAAFQRGKEGEVYNLGGKRSIPNLDVVYAILKELKGSEELVRLVKDRPIHDRCYRLNSSRAREELQWEPRTPFEEALRRTVRWYQDHPEWWRPVIEGDPEFQRFFQQWYGERLEG